MCRVADKHQVSHLTIQCALAGKHKPKAETVSHLRLLVTEEELALKIWCLDVAKWEFPVCNDFLHQMAAAVIIDCKQ